ncbi:hypothetical protein FQN57_001351 [Myotisia sp. PD_48]|nr:hypothetical protein FQN57_001351 [Myotisia sp. PD_48]
MASTQQTEAELPQKIRKCSCLCGNIRFQLTGEPLKAFICHCLNCKKTTGAPFFGNGVFLKEQVSSLPEDGIKIYADSNTDSGRPIFKRFCTNCGSLLSIEPQVPGILSVPVGTLDQGETPWKPDTEVYSKDSFGWHPNADGVEMAGHFRVSLPAGQGSSAHHRYQASLEAVLDFSSTPSLPADDESQARILLCTLIAHFEPLQSSTPYRGVALVRLTYEQCRSVDMFLQQTFTYFDGLHCSIGDTPIQPTFERGLARFAGFSPQSPAAERQEVEDALNSFGEYLFSNFFLPMKAAGSKTPQASAASLSAPAIDNVVGTSARLSVLRRDCLIRDHHRCVVTRLFDSLEAVKREEHDPQPVDDDGHLITGPIAQLEVAHIIPHSIMSFKATDVEPELGSNIDRPSNAISITTDLHTFFGQFKLTFEAVDPTNPSNHTYRINGSTALIRGAYNLPVTRTLLLSPNHTINPPSAKLLALHCAIARILQLSAAGAYVDRIIRDMEEVWVPSDGSAELGRIVGLKLGGWFDGVSV